MVLLAVYTSDGCVGRCDARCYDAHTAHCTCICGGTNHGVGQAQAITNTREAFEPWIARYATEKGLTTYHVEVGPGVLQLSMF
jgi:hypothetical protein